MAATVNSKCQLPHHIFTRNFYTLGGHITRNPYWFVVVPFFVTLVLSTGLQRMREIVDLEYFVTVDDSDIVRNRKILDKLFPMNLSSDFDLGRYTHLGSFGSVIITTNDSVLKRSTFNEILFLDQTVKNITVSTETGIKSYRDLCVKTEDSCYSHDFLNFEDSGNTSDTIHVPYPIDFNNRYSSKFYGASFGGVEIDSGQIIKSAKALRLFYFLDYKKHKNDIAIWEDEFLKTMKSFRLPHFDLYYIISRSVAYEMHMIPFSAIPYFLLSAIFVVLFTVATCMVPNSVQGKPWVGIMTSISSLLSSLSGFGLAFYLDIPYIFYNAIIPFLILGVSMDDTFVLLSAWRHTNRKNSVEERMSEAYSTASLAITITSLTNVITFIIGYLMSPYSSVRIFCIVTTFCLVFDYAYQLTFVGGCMVICGIVEEKNRHCFTFIPIKNEENKEIRGILQKFLYYSGHIQLNTDTANTSFLLEIWKKLGELLTKKVSKLVVFVLFSVYFIFGLQNATKITNELEMGNMALYRTHTDEYFVQHNKYFVQYLSRIQVFIDRPIDYEDPSINRTLHGMFEKFESLPFLCNSSLTESWLRSFHNFVNNDRFRGLLTDYNITDKRDFIRVLRVFLKHPLAKRFRKDIVFNENRTEIVASRFLFQTNYTKDDSTFNNMWWDFLNHVENQKIPVKVFHRFGYFSDGFRRVIPATLQTIGISAGIVAFVCFFFFFSFSCTLCVAVCIISVTVGVLGYMRLWGVSLNLVSMTVIIIVSGFSVDYASHISCAYLFNNSKSTNQRLISAVSDVGLPIFQAGLTTVLCVIPFVVPPCYTYNVIMKVVILVSSFAIVHAVIFLPVFLSLVDDACFHVKNVFKRRKKVNLANKSENRGHVNYAIDAKDVSVFSYKNDAIKL